MSYIYAVSPTVSHVIQSFIHSLFVLPRITTAPVISEQSQRPCSNTSSSRHLILPHAHLLMHSPCPYYLSSTGSHYVVPAVAFRRFLCFCMILHFFFLLPGLSVLLIYTFTFCYCLHYLLTVKCLLISLLVSSCNFNS